MVSIRRGAVAALLGILGAAIVAAPAFAALTGAHPESAVFDNCVASCLDWYGNARPIFLGHRTLALMGYELVEGAIDENAIRETARANFSPGAMGR